MLNVYKAAVQRLHSQLKRFLTLSVSGVMLVLTGCSVNNEDVSSDVVFTDKSTALQHSDGKWSSTSALQMKSRQVQRIKEQGTGFQGLTAVIANLLDDLVQFNQGLESTQLLVVATPVFLNGLEKTDPLGLVLQDSLMTGLQQRQFTVIDANMGAKLRITKQGDFMLTRDWQQLSSSLMVDHALVSTMSVTSEGLILNTRLLNIDNKRLVSSAQAFFNYDELTGFMAPPKQTLLQQEMSKTVWQGAEQAMSVNMNETTNKDNVLKQEGLSSRAIEFF